MKRLSVEESSPSKRSCGALSPPPEMDAMMPPPRISPLICPCIETTSPSRLTPSLASFSPNTIILGPETSTPSPQPIQTLNEPEQRTMSESNVYSIELLRELEPAGYRPVWHWRLGFPGEIPDDVAQNLYPGVEKDLAIIGPLSSLFWLGGCPELCELIYQPWYVLTDEIERVPHGASFRWLFEMLRDEGKIPPHKLDRGLLEPSRLSSPVCMLSRMAQIPAAIQDSVKELKIANVFPLYRTQSLPAYVSMVKASLPSKFKQTETNALDLQNRFIRHLGGNLLFRGLSRSMLTSLMGFFTPVVMPVNVDNEFGPGFYTTSNLQYALGYSRAQGVILVFKNADFRHLKSLQLEGREWQLITKFWAGRTASNIQERIPTDWVRSDVLKGPVSTDVPGGTGVRAPGEYDQVVGVSPAALLAFAAALRMIIWLE